MRALTILVSSLALLSLAGCSTTPETNSLVVFFDGAERQSETDDQRREIERALRDTLEMPAEELKRQRYADYQMNRDTWTVVELLSHYFVPNVPAILDPTTFYRDIASSDARSAVQEQLRALND